MKTQSIIFLGINFACAVIGIVFSFCNIFLEKTELKYCIKEGQSLFAFKPNIWTILASITLILIIITTVAMFVFYILMKIKNKLFFWKGYLITATILCGLIIAFIVFAINVCVSKSVFGFGMSTDYKFNVSCYVFIILISFVAAFNLYNALDTNRKLLK